MGGGGWTLGGDARLEAGAGWAGPFPPLCGMLPNHSAHLLSMHRAAWYLAIISCLGIAENL
jgi:hypothetical protein